MKVINGENLPTRPLGFVVDAAVVGLLMDRFHAPSWAWGAYGLFFGVVFIASVIRASQQEPVKIFGQDPKTHNAGGKT